jgi:hypothetical protein
MNYYHQFGCSGRSQDELLLFLRNSRCKNFLKLLGLHVQDIWKLFYFILVLRLHLGVTDISVKKNHLFLFAQLLLHIGMILDHLKVLNPCN